MAKLTIFVSWTFVLFLSASVRLWASPIELIPDESVAEKEAASENAKPLHDGLTISQPKPGKVGKRAPEAGYYPFQQQLTVRAGRGTKLKGAELSDNLIGFQYLFPRFLAPKYEFGGDLTEDGGGHIHLGKRWIFSERSYFRPSVKVAIDHLIEADERLATLTNHENYFLRLSGTLEYVFKSPYSVRLEPEALAGTQGFLLFMTLGLSRGW